MLTPDQLFGILAARPFPGSVDLRMSSGACCLTVAHIAIGYNVNGWVALGRVIPAEWPIPFDFISNAERVHEEIRRVLAIVKGEIQSDDDRNAALQDRLAAEIDRRRDVEAQLAKMTDAHAVVTQRLIGAQKEIGEMDTLRSQLAVAVGLDDSASLALILEAVKNSRPASGLNTLSGLLDVLAAPVAFGERRLSTVERAEWALRRWLTESKACDARMAQLIEAEVYLDVLGVPAYATMPGDDPGDASEALTLPERLRLHFGAQS